LEVLCHLRDSDRDVCVPRLARVLAEDGVSVDDVDMAGWEHARRYGEQDGVAVLAEWRAARAALVRQLAPLGRREWARHAADAGARVLVLGRLGAHPDARAAALRQLWEIEELARRSGAPALALRVGPVLGPWSPLWRLLAGRPRLPRRGAKLVNPVAEED